MPMTVLLVEARERLGVNLPGLSYPRCTECGLQM